jgi:hypothetical protein
MWAQDKLIVPVGIYDLNDDLSFVQGANVLSFQSSRITDQDLSLMIQPIETQAPSETDVAAAAATPTPMIEPTERPVVPQPEPEWGGVLTPKIGTYIFYGLIALVVIIGIVGITRTIRGGRKM